MSFNQRWLSLSLGGVILAGVIADRKLFQIPAANAEPYHEKVRLSALSLPSELAGWRGEDIPVPQSAQKLLRSNVIVSRQYTKVREGIKEYFNILLVQCGDARDLLGHYPPNCYPATGYTLISQKYENWPAGDLETHGTTYQFSQDTLQGTKAMNVYDFMILPDGQTSPNLEGVYRIARNRRMRYFGAAQVQVITDVGMSDADRTEIIKVVLNGARPVIDTIRMGVAP